MREVAHRLRARRRPELFPAPPGAAAGEGAEIPSTVGNALPLTRAHGGCPQCHRGHLSAVRTTSAVNLLCSACGACWSAGPRLLCRVDPASCPGCPSSGRCTPEGPDDAGSAAV